MLCWNGALNAVVWSGVGCYTVQYVAVPQIHIIAQASTLLLSSLVILGKCLKALCLSLLKLIGMLCMGLLKKIRSGAVGAQHIVDAH